MLGLFFGFNGRINRLTYWLGNLIVGFCSFLAIMFTGVLLSSQPMEKTTSGILQAVAAMGLVWGPIFIAMGWAGMALQVKRFHDRGRSGLLVLLPFVPFTLMFLAIVNGAMSNAPYQAVLGEIQIYINILWLINFAFFIDLGCLGSKDGPNKYGDEPGSGFGGGKASHSAPSAPATSAPAGAGGLAFLGTAENAMDRAIAERMKAATRASTEAPKPAPMMAQRPAMAQAPAGGASFGRKPSR